MGDWFDIMYLAYDRRLIGVGWWFLMKDVFEELVVVKRSGQRVNFNNYKIAVAIKNAFDNVSSDYNEKDINNIYEGVLLYIENNYVDRRTINVEDIQDIIETKLKDNDYKDVYLSFSEYRKKRAASRGVFTARGQHKFVKAMEKIIDENIIRVDNSYSPNEIILKYGKIVANEFAKSYIIDSKYLRAHEEGNIYIHDLESFPLGMVSHTHFNYNNIFKDDFSIDDLINLIVNSKKEISGYINIPSLDFLLEDYIYKLFKVYYKELLINYLKVTGFYSYMNIKKIIDFINRDFVLPFNINSFEQFTLSNYVKNIFENAYDDTLDKIEKYLYDNINKLFVKLENFSDNNSKFSISFGTNNSFLGTMINSLIIRNINELEYLDNVKFIFKLDSLENKFLDSVIQLFLNGKNLFLSFPKNSYNFGINEVEYFGNGVRIYENYNDNERYSKGRMIIATTSINMARLGLKHENNSKDKFYDELDRLLELVKNELLLSFEFIGNRTKDNYKYLFGGNIETDEKLEAGGKIRKVIKNSNLNIGLVGLKECICIMCKDKKKEIKFLDEILNYINQRCCKYTEETKINFFISEPYESSASSYFMALDKSIYGIRSGITDSDCYDIISNIEEVKDNLKLNGKLQKLVAGGNMINIVVPSSVSHKDVKDKIIEIFKSDLGFVHFIMKDGDILCK